MRRVTVSIFLFVVCTGAVMALGGCGESSQSASPAPSDKQVSKEKMKPTSGKPK